jgi:hypothetical protein
LPGRQLSVGLSANKNRKSSSAVALVSGIYLGDAIQNIQPPGLAGDVGVMILFRQHNAGVVFAILRSNPLQLVEELVQFSPSKPPIEQVRDLLRLKRLVSKRRS